VLAGGIFLLPSTGTMLLTGALAGRVAGRFGSKMALVFGAAVTAASFIVLSFAHDHSWDIYVAAALLGAGVGLAFAAMGNLIVQAVPAEQTGVASGMNTVMRTIGGAVGSQVAATLITGHLGVGGLPAEHGYVLAFLLSLAFLAVCILASLLVPGRRPRGRGQRLDPAAAEG
jgi:MFS family permease